MKNPRRPGRPRDRAKAAAILDAGWALFLAHGVEATPIQAIAARARVSKVTLYAHYPDKAALFEAAILREMERIEQAQQNRGAHIPAPIADRLHAFGLGLMSYLTSPPAIDFYNAIAGELRRHPALARAFHERGPGRSRTNLARLIAAAAATGELVIPSPEHAADQLFGLWQGFTNFQLALDVDVPAIQADLPARVARGVDAFMRLYAPTTPAQPVPPPPSRPDPPPAAGAPQPAGPPRP